MVIRAYDECYVDGAQRILGDMMDFAVNSCGLEPDGFFEMFLRSGIARQFGEGNPSVIAGKTGCELVRMVLEICGQKEPDVEDEMFLDKSPEYWCGWALAAYQWYCGKSFQYIYSAVSIKEILRMYDALHEADIMKFIETMDEKLRLHYPETSLKRKRKNLGLSQRRLAELSGVPIRQIQLFEERARDINKARAETVYALARTLYCRMEELME